MSIFIENTEYLYAEEVAKKLGIAETTLKVRVRAKEMPLPIDLKSKNIWKLSDIDDYINKISSEKK